MGASAAVVGFGCTAAKTKRIALGGPEASFAFALVLSAPILFPAPAWLKIGSLALALLNAGIGGLSLLPVHPLDGHKLVVGIVWWAVGSEERARRIINRVGVWLLAVDLSL